MGFSQPELEALLVEQATELGVNIFRGLGEEKRQEEQSGRSREADGNWPPATEVPLS